MDAEDDLFPSFDDFFFSGERFLLSFFTSAALSCSGEECLLFFSGTVCGDNERSTRVGGGESSSLPDEGDGLRFGGCGDEAFLSNIGDGFLTGDECLSGVMDLRFLGVGDVDTRLFSGGGDGDARLLSYLLKPGDGGLSSNRLLLPRDSRCLLKLS